MRNLRSVAPGAAPHWVGDGFPVRSLFSHMDGSGGADPFLMLDYAGPHAFAPASRPRGVDVHPHKGFETVTIVYQGEVEHGDSTGKGGIIGPGDVQWMTAASGLLHKEFHSQAFTRAGGTLEMVQLWVNLPARAKAAEPGYQSIGDREIPALTLPEGAGSLRVIAGSYDGHSGPARTFTPIEVWDLCLNDGKGVTLDPPAGHSVTLALLEGELSVNGARPIRGAAALRLEGEGEFSLAATGKARLLVLAGAPIGEPIAAYGPFVMNRQDEIRQAIADVQSGKFGRL